MDNQTLQECWLTEERNAHITGWDFSHIAQRHTQAALPWDYGSIIRQHLQNDFKILDIDTGGGEFLLSLGHPTKNLAATEAYPPNVRLCAQRLLPLGVDFREADGKGSLPFEDDSFDMVLNRHGDLNPGEIFRVLKPGGIFITQQVGAENDRELAALVFGKAPPVPYPQQYLRIIRSAFESAGFVTLWSDEAKVPIRFFDTGALVWFARIIPWEFPDFSVSRCLENLYKAEETIRQQGFVEGQIHRFLLVAQKPSL